MFWAVIFLLNWWLNIQFQLTFHDEVIKMWTKLLHLWPRPPPRSGNQAKASAILWAVELAAKEHWDCVIFEGDAKACYNPLSSNITPDWAICSIISDIKILAKD